MPHRCAPVGEIRCPPEVEVEVLMTGNLWENFFGGFWWVHSDANQHYYCVQFLLLELHYDYPNCQGICFNRCVPIYQRYWPFFRVDVGWLTCHIVQTCSKTPKVFQASYVNTFGPEDSVILCNKFVPTPAQLV